MKVEYRGSIKVLIADEGKKITNTNRSFFADFIYLGINDSPDNYDEVGREIWKYYIEEENPDVVELQAQTKDINETMDVIMTALATSDEQSYEAIDVILLAIDDLYMLLDGVLNKDGE